jgi:hypothetical protein
MQPHGSKRYPREDHFSGADQSRFGMDPNSAQQNVDEVQHMLTAQEVEL